MNIDFSELKSEANFIATYARGGAAPEYAFPVARLHARIRRGSLMSPERTS